MNNKAQFDYPIIAFIIILGALILLAPVMLKIYNEIQTPFSASLGNISGGGGQIAQENFNTVIDTGYNFWDEIIIFALFVSIILMFVSAFLIDAHPIFIVIFIVFSFITILVAPTALDAVGTIYDSASFTTEVASLTFMDFIRSNIGIFLVVLMFLNGIIIFGKIAFFRSEGGGPRY